MSNAIGSVVGITGYKFQIVGYVCTGDGVQVIGNSIEADNLGMEKREWVSGFNRDEAQVWQDISTLPIPKDAQIKLGEEGVYPANVLDVVGMIHDKWRIAIGKEPDSHFMKMVRGGKSLKTSHSL